MKPEIVEELARAMAPIRHQYCDYGLKRSKPMAVDLMLTQAIAPIIDRLVSEAREATEAAIVAWLRKDAAEWRGGYPDGAEKASAVDLAAEAIEAGAHRG